MAIPPSRASRTWRPTLSVVKPSARPRGLMRSRSSCLPNGRSSSTSLTPGTRRNRSRTSSAAALRAMIEPPLMRTSISRPGGPPCRGLSEIRSTPGSGRISWRQTSMKRSVRTSPPIRGHELDLEAAKVVAGDGAEVVGLRGADLGEAHDHQAAGAAAQAVLGADQRGVQLADHRLGTRARGAGGRRRRWRTRFRPRARGRN